MLPPCCLFSCLSELKIRTGFIEAAKIFSANEARPIEDLPSVLKSLVPLYSNIYVDSQFAPQRRGRSKSVLKYFSSTTSKSEQDGLLDVLPSSKRLSLTPELAKLRSIKSPAETRAMRNAADVSGRAHAKVNRLQVPLCCVAKTSSYPDYAIYPAWPVRIRCCRSF